MKSKALITLLLCILFLPACSTLNVELDSIADEIGDHQRRDECLKEHRYPCPEEVFPVVAP